MAERSAIQIFRIIAPEFKDVPDTEVEAMLELCEPLVSKRRFGRVYNQALALLAAHRLKLSGKGQDTGAESPCGSGITASPGKRPGSCHRTAGPPCQNNLRVKSKVKLTWGYRNDKITLSPTKEGVFK